MTGPPLERRPAPGGGSEGRRARSRAENQTLASITFQNYFRLYGKLGRHDRHGRHRGLRVPGDLRSRDHDHPAQPSDAAAKTSNDRVYKTTKREVRSGRSNDIRECHERGQPVLVGTSSRSRTPKSSTALLAKADLPHQVLNAKQHAQARPTSWRRPGRTKMITIATNMAGPRHRHRARRQCREGRSKFGRGRRVDRPGCQGRRRRPVLQKLKDEWDKDCMSSGQERWAACASLPPSGTRARRIDNQLRGRSRAAKGDPGSSRAST